MVPTRPAIAAGPPGASRRRIDGRDAMNYKGALASRGSEFRNGRGRRLRGMVTAGVPDVSVIAALGIRARTDVQATLHLLAIAVRASRRIVEGAALERAALGLDEIVGPLVLDEAIPRACGDRDRGGNGPPGELHPLNTPPRYARRLTAEIVVAIRAGTLSTRAAARQFGVSHVTISHIRTGQTWRGRPPEPPPRLRDPFQSRPRKLTLPDAWAIQDSPEPGTVLAARYRISPSLVSQIRHHRAW